MIVSLVPFRILMMPPMKSNGTPNRSSFLCTNCLAPCLSKLLGSATIAVSLTGMVHNHQDGQAYLQIIEIIKTFHLCKITKNSDYCQIIMLFDYIRAFCFSPAPEPRYLERASLNFQVRSSIKVRRAGLCVVNSR